MQKTVASKDVSTAATKGDSSAGRWVEPMAGLTVAPMVGTWVASWVNHLAAQKDGYWAVLMEPNLAECWAQQRAES